MEFIVNKRALGENCIYPCIRDNYLHNEPQARIWLNEDRGRDKTLLELPESGGDEDSVWGSYVTVVLDESPIEICKPQKML